jgi:hypothetical protein
VGGVPMFFCIFGRADRKDGTMEYTCLVGLIKDTCVSPDHRRRPHGRPREHHCPHMERTRKPVAAAKTYPILGQC